MKKSIVCIVPFRNEVANIEIYMERLEGIADEVYGFDDRSTDNTAKKFEEFGGKLIGKNGELSIGWSNSSKVRQSLLDAAIKSSHTHLMVVDLDELILSEDPLTVRRRILELTDEEVLTVDWYNLHGSVGIHTLLDSKTNHKKILARKITSRLKFSPGEYLHFPQIPVFEDDQYIHENIPLIHYQACDLEKFAIKQIWYMMMTFRETSLSARAINATYLETMKPKYLGEIPKEWIPTIQLNSMMLSTDWRMREIEEMLSEDGIEKYRFLNIWNKTLLEDRAINAWGRIPKPALDTYARRKMRSSLKRLGLR